MESRLGIDGRSPAARRTPGSAPRSAAPSGRRRVRGRRSPSRARAPPRRGAAAFPEERTARRCTKFSSSRTFPFHGCGGERLERFLREGAGRAGKDGAVLPQEVVRQQRDVLLPLGEGRDPQREDVEPVEEVGAELPLGHEPAAGRGSSRRGSGRGTSAPGRSPTGVYSRSCSTRSSFACRSSGMSPISSRKRVPPSGGVELPVAPALSAPVKAPFSCPNSSASWSSRGIAGVFTATKGPCAPPRSWMQRAISSFPTPRSPRIRIVAFESAIFPMFLNTSMMARLFPTIR